MTKHHQRKLKIFLVFATGLILAFSLMIFSLRQNLNVFVSPSDLTQSSSRKDTSFRLGGVVKPGSVRYSEDKATVSFFVTDLKHAVKVTYGGILPDLFREGTGIIVEGRMTSQGVFMATNVLAKHDENYMPKSAYLALRKQSA